MDSQQEEFLRELLEDFKIEAAEHHQAIVNGLIKLEKAPDSASSQSDVEIIFREIHSMKGAARAVNLGQIEQLCMGMENVFHEVKKGNLKLIPAIFDTFLKAADYLEIMIAEIDSKQKTVSENNLSQFKRSFEGFVKKTPPGFGVFHSQPRAENLFSASKPETPIAATLPDKQEEIDPLPVQEPLSTEANKPLTELPSKLSDKETVRVATSKLYDLLRQAEEMVTVKTSLKFQIEQLELISNKFDTWRKKQDDWFAESTLLIEEGESHHVEEIARQKVYFKKHAEELSRVGVNLEQMQRIVIRSVDEMLLDIKKTLLYPFSSLLNIVPKIVRDLGKEYNKDINLQMEGGEIEIDRRILEEMKDPLIHLIRNCIDHGLETKPDRLKGNKPVTGNLTITIRQDNQNIEMLITDDGAGINTEKLINSSIKSGLIKPEDVKGMSKNDVNMLIFSSGVSTSPFITDVSGRGLGMAIVAEKVAGIEGTIELETEQGKGTSFKITLPQTMAAFRGILVRTSDQLFIIPTSAVIKALQIKPSDIRTVGSKKTISFRSETIALVHLREVLNIRHRPAERKQQSAISVLILQLSQKKIAFIIDEVLGEQEGVVKNFGPQLRHVTNIAGATLLGNGKIVPILNIPELMLSAANRSLTTDIEIDRKVDVEGAEVIERNILVAEDSITVRNMLRNFIEAAGFTVKTAVDGMQAFEMIKAEPFDLVVSDVEMPRMNGFELTAQIRQNNKLSDTPVILVTSLDSSDDRQKGLEAGANAYIVKGSFEKSNLIETIQRLI